MTSVDGYKTCDYDEHQNLAAQLVEANAKQDAWYKAEAEWNAKQMARIRDLEAALVHITHIGPLGVDTYPECYRLIQLTAEAALSGARTAKATSQADGEGEHG